MVLGEKNIMKRQALRIVPGTQDKYLPVMMLWWLCSYMKYVFIVLDSSESIVTWLSPLNQ